jgi:four helix bundle protein
MAAGKAKGFESLRIYRLSEDLADRIWDVVSKWQLLARDTVGKQLIRAADSIGANLAEGSGRGTYRDNCRFVDVARGSLYETRHFLRRAFKRKLLPKAEVDRLRPLIAELGPKLNAYRNSLRRRRTSNK